MKKTGIFELRNNKSGYTVYFDVRRNGCLIRFEGDEGTVTETMGSVYSARAVWADEVKDGCVRVR